MKALVLKLSLASALLIVSQQSIACTVTPQGDSHLRVTAIHNAIDQMEAVTEFKALDGDIYQVRVRNFNTGKDAVRTYRLENTSRMCPVHKATLID